MSHSNHKLNYTFNFSRGDFLFSSLDGKLLSLDDIWKQVPETHRDFLKYDKWSFITEQVSNYSETYGERAAAFSILFQRKVEHVPLLLSYIRLKKRGFAGV